MIKSNTGRPRSEKSQDAIIQATTDLLKEEGSLGLTIETIAKRAGVGKPTIYRWYPSLADVVLEALLGKAKKVVPVPTFTSLLETLVIFLKSSMEAIVDGNGDYLRFLMAYAQKDDAFRERFRENFVSERRDVLKGIFTQAMGAGEIGLQVNLDMLVDIVFGAMWYRLLVGHSPLNSDFAEQLANMVMKIVQPE